VWAPLNNVASGRVHLTLMPINWYRALLATQCQRYELIPVSSSSDSGRQAEEGKAKEVSGGRVAPSQCKRELWELWWATGNS
jgi:hypothetical protein